MSQSARSLIRRFALSSLLWLPLAFFAWWGWGSVLVLPAALMSEWLLLLIWPETFQSVEMLARDSLRVFFVSYVEAEPVLWGSLFADINPLKYGYGFPLFIGMVMAVPQAPARQAWLIGLGYLLMVVLQVWGIVFESMRNVAFEHGIQVLVWPQAAESAGLLEAIQSGQLNPGQVLLLQPVGLAEELIALFYQLGYLIFPAVVPIIVWMLMHTAFVEQVTGKRLSDSLKATKSASNQDQ